MKDFVLKSSIPPSKCPHVFALSKGFRFCKKCPDPKISALHSMGPEQCKNELNVHVQHHQAKTNQMSSTKPCPPTLSAPQDAHQISVQNVNIMVLKLLKTKI